MANKPFNANYIVVGTKGESIILNGDQIVKITAQRAAIIVGWEVTFWMSDGTHHTVSGDWANNFVKMTFNKE